MALHPELMRISARDLRHSKKMLFAFLISLAPLALVILGFIGEIVSHQTGYVNPPPLSENDFYPVLAEGLAFFGLTISIPLVCIILAGGSIADEAEERTLSYLLVKPIKRSTLYLTRTFVVWRYALALVLLQVISVWLVDLLSFAVFDGASETLRYFEGDQEFQISATALLFTSLPLGLFVAALAATLYTAMFSAISLIFTRFHFFANLVWFGIWELLFGLSFLPIAWLSGMHGLQSILNAIDRWSDTTSQADGFWGLLGLPIVLALTTLWLYIGVRVVKNRDFHITSAAT